MHWSRFLIFLCLQLSRILVAQNALNCSTTSTQYMSVYEGGKLVYNQFTSLSQLNIECDFTTFFEPNSSESLPIFISFDKIGVLNEPISFSFLSQDSWKLSFMFSNVKGFEIEMNGPIFRIDSIGLFELDFVFFNSDVDFYYKEQLIEANLCNIAILNELDIKLFGNLSAYRITFDQNCNYRNPICPYVFKNANISILDFANLEHDLITSSSLSFLQIKNEENRSLDLNCAIDSLQFASVFRLCLNLDQMSPLVCERISDFQVEGTLGTIADNLFRSFQRLSMVTLNLANMRSFFHSSHNTWLQTIFHQAEEFNSTQEKCNYLLQNKNGSTYFKLLFIDVKTFYDYPEEDFCLFKYFPSNKLVAALLSHYVADTFKRINESNKTLTMKFLEKNTVLINQVVHLSEEYQMIYVNITETDAQLIEGKLAQCFNLSGQIISEPYVEKFYFNMNNVIYVLKWFEFIGPVVTFPIASAVAFFLNLLVILIITSKRNKAEKLFETRMFKFILLNSVFNCSECLIYQFRLLNMCMGINTVYCSSVRLFPSFETLGVILGYLSETMKTCSIVTGLMFSMQRYVEATKTENKHLKRFAHSKFRRLVFFLVFLSGFASSTKVLEYEFNYAFYESPSPFRMSIDNIGHANYFIVSSVLYMTHYILNDFLLLLVNLFIDILLVRHIKKDLKMKIQHKFNATEFGNQSNENQLIEAIKKKKSVEKKANALVISSIFIYTLCRLPELVGEVMFYMEFMLFPQEPACTFQIICYLIYNTIEYIYMISYLFSILTLYKFNTNFKRGFNNFFR